MSDRRIKWIDALKLFAIFLVLWGHSIQYLSSAPYAENPLFRAIYSFHMPLFMMLSGFLGGRLLTKDIKEVVRDKGRRLLVPVVSFGMLWGLSDISDATGRIAGFWIDSLWFLKSAFICMVIFRIVMLPRRHGWLWLLLSVIAVQPIDYCDLWQMYPCFVTGWILRNYFDSVRPMSGWILSITAIVFVGMLLFFGPEYFSAGGPGSYIADEIAANMKAVIWISCYKMIIGIVGAVFFILLFERCSHLLPASPAGDALCRVGTYSLEIYVMQWFFLERFLASRLDFGKVCSGPLVFNLIITPVVSILVLALCLATIFLLKRSRHVGILMFGHAR